MSYDPEKDAWSEHWNKACLRLTVSNYLDARAYSTNGSHADRCGIDALLDVGGRTLKVDGRCRTKPSVTLREQTEARRVFAGLHVTDLSVTHLFDADSERPWVHLFVGAKALGEAFRRASALGWWGLDWFGRVAEGRRRGVPYRCRYLTLDALLLLGVPHTYVYPDYGQRAIDFRDGTARGPSAFARHVNGGCAIFPGALRARARFVPSVPSRHAVPVVLFPGGLGHSRTYVGMEHALPPRACRWCGRVLPEHMWTAGYDVIPGKDRPIATFLDTVAQDAPCALCLPRAAVFPDLEAMRAVVRYHASRMHGDRSHQLRTWRASVPTAKGTSLRKPGPTEHWCDSSVADYAPRAPHGQLSLFREVHA